MGNTPDGFKKITVVDNTSELNELHKSIANGTDKQFVYNRDKDRVECRCGHAAVFWRSGYLCGTITAYPCKYN